MRIRRPHGTSDVDCVRVVQQLFCLFAVCFLSTGRSTLRNFYKSNESMGQQAASFASEAFIDPFGTR